MSKEYQGQPGLLDRRVPTALMAGVELTAAMALMVWMVLTVLLALLVHAVLRVTQDRSVPWVRRDLAGNRVYREHRANRDRVALMDSIWRSSASTNASPSTKTLKSRSARWTSDGRDRPRSQREFPNGDA